jgi:hypothetical protein
MALDLNWVKRRAVASSSPFRPVVRFPADSKTVDVLQKTWDLRNLSVISDMMALDLIG